jgi:hypothetical protein
VKIGGVLLSSQVFGATILGAMGGGRLDEMVWRFDNRRKPFLFRDTMLKLIHSDNLAYKELTKVA